MGFFVSMLLNSFSVSIGMWMCDRSIYWQNTVKTYEGEKMIKIQRALDLKRIKNKYLQKYISDLLQYLFKTYEVDNIERFGAIFYIEAKVDFDKFKEFHLSAPLSESRFEWIEDVGNGYVNGCVVIDNDTAINLVGKKELFKDFITEDQ